MRESVEKLTACWHLSHRHSIPVLWVQHPSPSGLPGFLCPAGPGTGLAPAAQLRAGGKRSRVLWEHWSVRGWTQRKPDQFWSRDLGMPTGSFRMLGASKSGCKLLRAEICPFLGSGRDICCTTCNGHLDYSCSYCSSSDKLGVFLLVHSFLSVSSHV